MIRPHPSCFQQRSELPAQGTTLYRAIQTSESDGLFSLDVANEVGILSLYQPLSAAQELELAEACAQAGALSSVYLKRRPVQASHVTKVDRPQLCPPEPLWGQAQPEVVALEEGVPFLIRPGADLSIGLFTDARPARRWVRERAARRVLNTFAYTCGFGLMAALAGAEVVKNVDLSRKVLKWGQENYALSGLPAPDFDFLYGDVFDWLRRLRKRQDRFDLIILDPPSFARHHQQVWQAAADYPQLVQSAVPLLNQGGQLLVMLNQAGISDQALEQQVQTGLREAGRSGRCVQRFGAGPDYPGATHLKVQVWAVD